MEALQTRSVVAHGLLVGLMLLSLCLGAIPVIAAGPIADYGDAPDPSYPSLYNTTSTAYSGRRGPYHLDVSKEWIGTASTSTTTMEADALVPGLDLDDGIVQVRWGWVGGSPTQIGFVSVSVTIAPGTSGDVRYLNVVADFNRDGQWAAYSYGGATLQEEWVAKNVALMFAPSETCVVVNSPFVWLDSNIDTTTTLWMRVTLTTETIDPAIFGAGVPGWDGSGPDAGFVRGETEDWLVIPQTVPAQPDPTGRDPNPPELPTPLPGVGPGGGPGVSPGPSGGAGNGNPPTGGIENHPVPDIWQNPRECGPTSAANSLYYLGAAKGFGQLLPGSPQDPWPLIDMLKGYMNWNWYWGVTDSDFLDGKRAITRALRLPIETDYQDDGEGQVPDPAWIMTQLDLGADVELGLTWDGGGGHWVTAVGYTKYANGDVVIKVHDPADGLTGDVHYRMGDRDGYLSLLDYRDLNRIDIVVSEHKPVTSVPGINAPSAAASVGSAYPNPMNPTATIRYALGAPGAVKLRLFDAAGRVIRTLVDETKAAGTYSVTWDGTDDRGEKVASGVFFYQLEALGYRSAKKIIVLR